MLGLGIIGTNWITHEFVKSAHVSGEYLLTAVYSRDEKKAEQFAKEYENADKIILATDLETFYQLPEIDVIYIASPNSLHYEQAKAALKAGKHVISEKPAVSRLSELDDLIQVAKENKVFFFEAARHIHEENFKKVTELVRKRDDILGANFSFMKYSSRYEALLNGEVPNIFSPEFSGGALMDLGVYLIYAAVSWFGVPQETHYFHQKLPTGVDGLGTLIFRYNSFDVTMLTGKNADNYLPSEIYLSNETISIDAISSIQEIIIKKRNNTDEQLASPSEDNNHGMLAEAIAFSQVINHSESQEEQEKYQSYLKLAREVHQLMETIRKDAGIVFAADK